MTESGETVSQFLARHGIGDKTCQRKWFQKGEVRLNGAVASTATPVSENDILAVRSREYTVSETREPGRLTLEPAPRDDGRRIERKIRVQCGYHKCMTMYFRRLSKKTARWNNPFNGEYRHFFHRLDEFLLNCEDYGLSSVSGHCLDLNRFRDIRAVHIIRDPRDMVVSGYYYHKRAAEEWCHYINPTDEDWTVVNGCVPSALPNGVSLTAFLNSAPLDAGIAAEIDFRRKHFENMMRWPTDDPRVLTVKYEDLIGNEASTVRGIYDFYEYPAHTKLVAGVYADRYSLKGPKRNAPHIRNPRSGQWKEHFSTALIDRFNDEFGALLRKYDY